MSFSIASLEEETDYIIHIQAISGAGFGAMARLEFITPKLMTAVALSQTRTALMKDQIAKAPVANTSVPNKTTGAHIFSSFSVLLLIFFSNCHWA